MLKKKWKKGGVCKPYEVVCFQNKLTEVTHSLQDKNGVSMFLEMVIKKLNSKYPAVYGKIE